MGKGTKKLSYQWGNGAESPSFSAQRESVSRQSSLASLFPARPGLFNFCAVLLLAVCILSQDTALFLYSAGLWDGP